MAFRLIPRETSFNDLLDGLAARLPRASASLKAGAGIAGVEGEARAARRDVAKTVEELDRSFITPFDREDIYRLAEALAGVVAAIEEAAGAIDGPGFEPALAAIDEAAGRIDAAVKALREADKNAEALRGHLGAIADTSGRAARSLWGGSADPADPATALRRRDAREALRRTSDACRDAGRAVGLIVVKGV